MLAHFIRPINCELEHLDKAMLRTCPVFAQCSTPTVPIRRSPQDRNKTGTFPWLQAIEPIRFHSYYCALVHVGRNFSENPLMSELPASLISALEKKTLIPFVGAGVSRNVLIRVSQKPAFANWQELLENALSIDELESNPDIVKTILDLIHQREYLLAASQIRKFLGERGWNDFLKNQFDKHYSEIDERSLNLAQLVWHLGSALVITTNYDHVLRWAAPEYMMRDMVETCSEDVHNVSNILKDRLDRATVWHLHGLIDNPASIILTEEDYQRLYGFEETQVGEKSRGTLNAALTTLRAELVRYSFLFLGFSLTDPEFLKQLEWVKKTFAGNESTHYIIALDRDVAAMQERLQGLPIKVVPVSGFAKPLQKMLADLAAHVPKVTVLRSIPRQTGPLAALMAVLTILWYAGFLNRYAADDMVAWLQLSFADRLLPSSHAPASEPTNGLTIIRCTSCEPGKDWRSKYPDLIKALGDAGARVIAIDATLTGDDNTDARLGAAVHKAKSAHVLFALDQDEPSRKLGLGPEYFGSVAQVPGPWSDKLRWWRYRLFDEPAESSRPSFALQAFVRAHNPDYSQVFDSIRSRVEYGPDKRILTSPKSDIYLPAISVQSLSNITFDLSYKSVLDQSAFAKDIPNSRSLFESKIVLFGFASVPSSAQDCLAGQGDNFLIAGQCLPGYALQAAAIQALLSTRYFRRQNIPEFLAAMIITGIAAIGARRLYAKRWEKLIELTIPIRLWIRIPFPLLGLIVVELLLCTILVKFDSLILDWHYYSLFAIFAYYGAATQGWFWDKKTQLTALTS